MFAIFTGLLITFLVSKTARPSTLTVGDLIDRARDGLEGSLVYSPNLDFNTTAYVCGWGECEDVVIQGVTYMQWGRVYLVKVYPCQGLVCVNVTQGGGT